MFKKLIKDEKSILYAADRITRTRLNKARKSLYEKGKLFYKHYLDLEVKNVSFEKENTKVRITFYTPFVEQKKDINRLSALYSIKITFELVHADVEDLCFFSKSAVYPKYCLLPWILSPLKHLFF